MLRIIFSGAPLTAARIAEPPAVVKSIAPVTNAAMPVLVRMTMISAVNPSRLKKPSFAARCTGQEARPGEEGEMRTLSWASTGAAACEITRISNMTETWRMRL